MNQNFWKGKTVLVTVTGSDLAGHPITANLLRVQIRDLVEPRWEGITCVGTSGCGWNGSLIASFVDNQISATTFSGQAPIANATFVFENALSTYRFTSASFASNSIPDGTYSLHVELNDEAGRYFNTGHISFVYDNEAPVIEILGTLSNGLLSQDLILSCDECKLVWRVNDVTNSPSFTNHGNYPLISGQYEMSTATLADDVIVISATDELGRTSTIEINSTSIKSTEFNPVEELITDQGVKLLCIEDVPIQGLRQVTCLWNRVETNIDHLPVQIEIKIDQLQLRPVNVIVEKYGGGTVVQNIIIEDGIISLNGIQSHVTEFNLSVYDDYSEVVPIHYKLIEHIQPWSKIEFRGANLGESNIDSIFDIVLEPPVEEDKFHLLSKYSVDDLFSCHSEYRYYNLDGELVEDSQIQNCMILSSQINPNNELTMAVEVIHSNLSTHEIYILFNLESYSLILNYSDPLGVSSISNSWDLTFESEEITRAPDSLPTLQLPSNNCPLIDSEIVNHDGFLQSDYSVPLSECGDFISDPDGISRILWDFTFNKGSGSDYNVQIECDDVYFPQNWNLQKFIDEEKCNEPSNKFPEGSGYNVIIKLMVKDSSKFRDDDEKEFISVRLINQDCSDKIRDCELVELRVKEVTVSSDFNPLVDIANSRNFEKGASDVVSSGYYWFFPTVCLLLGAMVSLFMVSRRSNKTGGVPFSARIKNIRVSINSIIKKFKTSNEKDV